MGYLTGHDWEGTPSAPRVETWKDLTHEVERARAKFPKGRNLYVALAEEVGELAKALLQGRKSWRNEALQVACVAVRIYEEGCPEFDNLDKQERKP